MVEKTITKILSANDAGATGGHQAGLLIPREPEILSFFPKLGTSTKNPRVHLRFEDNGGRFWDFSFIYYNNKLFGGTRNEYRLTRMTRFIRETGLVAGDEVILRRSFDDEYAISYRRANNTAIMRNHEGQTVLKLGSGWKVINI